MKSDEKCCILVSRQGLRPNSNTPWVQQTQLVIEEIRARGAQLISSVGTPVWDLITVAAAQQGVRLKLVLVHHPANSPDPQRVIREYGLCPDRCTFEWVKAHADWDKADCMVARDRAVLDCSSTILSVAIRKGGTLDSLSEHSRAQGKQIDTRWHVPKRIQSNKAIQVVYPGKIASGVDRITADFLIHWTRGSNGPWPGETPGQLYRAVLDSMEWPRGAQATLEQIVRSGQVRASSRHQHSGTAVVSFTGCAPSEFLSCMRYRRRYREMSFEPYAIAIKRSRLIEMGAAPVVYHDSTVALPQTPVWQLQSQGTITDWRRECEYRYPGNVNLSEVGLSNLMLLGPNKQVAAMLSESTGIKAISLFE